MDHYEAGTAERSAPISREAIYIIIHVDLKLMLCVNKSPSEKECWPGLNYENWSRNSISKTAPKHFDGRKEQDHCVFFCHLTSTESFDALMSGCLFYPVSVTVFPTLTPVDSINMLLWD